MRGRTLKALAALLATAYLAAACTSGSGVKNASPSLGASGAVTGTAKQGGTLTVAIAGDPDSLDPALAQSEVSGDVLDPMCEGLYRRDANAQPQPALATGQPQVSADGKTVTIALRTGVVFNDGTAFNSSAVKQSLQLGAKLPGSRFQLLLANVARIDTSNPATVVFHLIKSDASMENELTYEAIASPAQRRKLGAKFGNNPVCVGPFVFVNRVSGTSITLKKSDLYYDKSKVSLTGIVFKVITDTNAREAAIKTGAADLAPGVPLTDIASLRSSGLRIISKIGGGWVGLAVNEANTNGVGKPQVARTTPLAQSAQLRQALGLSIDRKALAQVTSNGLDYAGCSPIPPNSPFFDHPQCPAMDLAKAKALVKASGYPTPIKIDVINYTLPRNMRLLEALQSMVAKAGFQLSISTFDLSTWISREDSGNFDVSLAVWLGAGEPSEDVGKFFASDGILDISGLHNASVDALLAQAKAATGVAARAPLYKQALAKIRADAGTTFLLNPAVALAARSNVVNFTFNPLNNIGIAFAGFKS